MLTILIVKFTRPIVFDDMMCLFWVRFVRDGNIVNTGRPFRTSELAETYALGATALMAAGSYTVEYAEESNG